jgi:hypothetical protein
MMGKDGPKRTAAGRAETAAELAAVFAEWRGGGLPNYGFADEFKVRVRAAAKAAGRGHADFLAEVHRLAYAIIDADPRVR